MEKIAKKFWKNQKKYPEYGTIKKRRLHELNYLVPKLEGVESLMDLGCGDGALIKCLRELTDIKTYFAYDIATGLMEDIPAITNEYDCTNPEPLPPTDFTVFAGVIPFLFEDEQVYDVLDEINSPVLYVKAPCSMEDEEIYVNTFSEKLGENYSSLYRTEEQMLDILGQYYNFIEVSRAYPDEIESEFGTKQLIFLCKNPSIR